MFDLRAFQVDRLAWERHNFPATVENPANRHHSLLGMIEEVGELSHALLKWEQKIREYDSEDCAIDLRADLFDGVGDLVIYLSAFCDQHNLDLEQCIAETWQKVRQRDWVKFPKDGMTQ